MVGHVALPSGLLGSGMQPTLYRYIPIFGSECVEYPGPSNLDRHLTLIEHDFLRLAPQIVFHGT